MTDEQKPEKAAFERLQRWKQKVIDFVIQGETPTAAVRKVKTKSKRPDLVASKLKKDPVYLEALEQRRNQAVEDSGVVNAQILIDVAAMANVNPKALVWCAGETLPEGATVGQLKKLHELDDVTARCIQSLEYSKDGDIKVRFPDKIQAKRLLGQYRRMWTESHEVNLGEKTLEQLLEASWNRPRPPGDDTPPAVGL